MLKKLAAFNLPFSILNRRYMTWIKQDVIANRSMNQLFNR